MLIKYEPFQAKNVLCKLENGNECYKSTYTLNPYRGCSVGCRYCYVQQKKYKDSTGFEEKKDQVVQVKINAPYLLQKKLFSEIEPAMITLGESCEPFADIEDEYFISQRLLEILKDHDFPLHIITRFSRVLRDIDIIKQINKRSFVCITISIPVVSKELVTKLEGNSPSVKNRLKTLKSIVKNNIAAGIAVSPVIPYISDGEEINRVLRKASEYGADYVLFSPFVIKWYQKEMFFSWLLVKYPGLVESYHRLYKDSEWPQKDYWNNFLQVATRKAQDLGLKVELPYDHEIMDQQELFRYNGR